MFHCEDKEMNREALNCVYLDTSLQVISDGEDIFAAMEKETISKSLYFVVRASCNDSWQMINVTYKFLSMYLFLFLTIYMFRAHRAHHQERQIVSIQPLVAVNLCWWPCRVQVGS